MRYNGSILGVDNTPSTSVASGVWDLQSQQLHARNGNWPSANYGIEYLVIAGGGGGGSGGTNHHGGGGGAGGYQSASATVVVGTDLTVTIGAGGAYTNATRAGGDNGSDSSFNGLTSTGGGGGGTRDEGPFTGGSGGGGAYLNGTGAAGTAGQGHRGGNYDGGGRGAPGGGAGGQGADDSTTAGNGITTTFRGTSETFATGGDGDPDGAVGSANTGDGGRGGSPNTGEQGGPGLSGVVIIRYLGPQRGTGGTVTSAGGYTIHTFNSSGTFTA